MTPRPPGPAAGTAAGMALDKGTACAAVDVLALQEELERAGAYLGRHT
jgi:hypothetical protein